MIQTVVKPVWQPGKCLHTRYNRLSNPLSNRLYNPVWQPVERTAVRSIERTAVRSTRLSNRLANPGLTTGWMFVYTIQPVVSCKRGFRSPSVSTWQKTGVPGLSCGVVCVMIIMFNRFNGTSTCDSQSDGHRAMVYSALAQRRAVKMMAMITDGRPNSVKTMVAQGHRLILFLLQSLVLKNSSYILCNPVCNEADSSVWWYQYQLDPASVPSCDCMASENQLKSFDVGLLPSGDSWWIKKECDLLG